jgi:hypothetical protein
MGSGNALSLGVGREGCEPGSTGKGVGHCAGAERDPSATLGDPLARREPGLGRTWGGLAAFLLTISRDRNHWPLTASGQRFTFTDLRHLAFSQIRIPIAHTSNGPGGSLSCHNSTKPLVASCYREMIPPAAMRLPRLFSPWKLRLDMVGRTDHECFELPLCRSEAPSRDPSGGATVGGVESPAETSHPAKQHDNKLRRGGPK